MDEKPKLKPETIARLQGILDGTIKVIPAPTTPADLSTLKPETRNRIAELLNTPQPVTPITQPIIQETAMWIEEPNDESLRNADEIIKTLAETGHGDYSALRKEIALDIYDNGHFNGNWDSHFNPDEYDSDLTGFRVIQEDEYDQHMDEDEDKPSWESMVADVPNGYLWMH